jgi:hypothetical protein
MIEYWSMVKQRWERFLMLLPPWLSPWVRDIVDVGVTVGVVIIALRLLFGADMLVPLVVVTSESMVHEPGDSSWSLWMTGRGLSEEEVSTFPMRGGFNMGDMILVKNPDANLGDIIIYERDLDHLDFPSKDPIIHRVVGIVHVRDYDVVGSEGTLDCYDTEEFKSYVNRVVACQKGMQGCPYTRYPETGDFRFYMTKGDHNDGTDQCSSKLNISHPVTDAQVTGRAFIRLPYIGWLKLLLNLILSVPKFIFKVITLQV